MKTDDTPEGLRKLVEEVMAENARLTEDNKTLQARILDLERAADTDPLVPVYNRRAFMREILRAQTVMARYDISSSLIYFDLNGFKAINDQYGHGIGDDLLTLTGRVLVGGVRDCDMVARLGGDEFGVLLFKTGLTEARAKAAILADRIADNKISIPTGEICVGTSWGVAPCEAEQSPSDVLERADRAMYSRKTGGRKRAATA